MEQSWIPGLWRSVYRCAGCGKRTVPCVNDCGAAAKGEWYWDDHFCVMCEGTIVSWPYPGTPWEHSTIQPSRVNTRRQAATMTGGSRQDGPTSTPEETLRASTSCLEVLRDCVEYATEGEILHQVSTAAQKHKKDLQHHIHNTQNEELLSKLLEVHSDLDAALASYDFLKQEQSQGSGQTLGGNAPATQSRSAQLSAAEQRQANSAARGRPSARSDPSPESEDPPAASAGPGWSEQAKVQFNKQITESLHEHANKPVVKPYPVSAPSRRADNGAGDSNSWEVLDAEGCEEVGEDSDLPAYEEVEAGAAEETKSEVDLREQKPSRKGDLEEEEGLKRALAESAALSGGQSEVLDAKEEEELMMALAESAAISGRVYTSNLGPDEVDVV